LRDLPLTSTMLTPNHRWYHITPARFFLGLLAVQVLLLLSEQFQWFIFNEHKGWTVLIAVAVVGSAVLVMLVWGLVSLCLRRRFQFSFRSLLVFVLAVSVSLGWFAWQLQKAKGHREAVEAIWAAGGLVMFDYQFDENGEWIAGAEPTTPAWLRKLLGDDFFWEVVRVLHGGTEFGDNDARHLKGMTKLEYLSLNDTQISDSGLAHLERLTKLRVLWLSNTQISDNGLTHLKEMAQLETLWLDGTQATDEGIKNLQEALPDCMICNQPP
jgi:hypothetical protein